MTPKDGEALKRALAAETVVSLDYQQQRNQALDRVRHLEAAIREMLTHRFSDSRLCWAVLELALENPPKE